MEVVKSFCLLTLNLIDIDPKEIFEHSGYEDYITRKEIIDHDIDGIINKLPTMRGRLLFTLQTGSSPK